MNIKKTISKLLKEEFDLNQGRTKLEKIIANFAEKNLNREKLTDNFYGVIVDIYDSDYGKECQITFLMKKPFKMGDSDSIHNSSWEIKNTIKDVFSGYNMSIRTSVSTIENYLTHRKWYDKNKS